MRYAERRLTNYKSDPCHKMAWKSCLARLPNTFNTKYDPPAKVSIIQKWNGVRAKPTKQFVYTDFLIYLVEKSVDFSAKARQKKNSVLQPRNSSNGYFGWIERVIPTPIADFRKLTMRQILCPYLATIKQIPKAQAYQEIMQWALECSKLSSLRPSVNEFSDKVHYSLDYTERKGMKPLGWDKAG